jgi:hypothetical protein
VAGLEKPLPVRQRAQPGGGGSDLVGTGEWRDLAHVVFPLVDEPLDDRTLVLGRQYDALAQPARRPRDEFRRREEFVVAVGHPAMRRLVVGVELSRDRGHLAVALDLHPRDQRTEFVRADLADLGAPPQTRQPVEVVSLFLDRQPGQAVVVVVIGVVVISAEIVEFIGHGGSQGVRGLGAQLVDAGAVAMGMAAEVLRCYCHEVLPFRSV